MQQSPRRSGSASKRSFGDLVAADRRIPKGGETGPVQGCFLPAAPFRVGVDDVPVFKALAREILEPAMPKQARPLLTKQVGQAVLVDLELLGRGHQTCGVSGGYFACDFRSLDVMSAGMSRKLRNIM